MNILLIGSGGREHAIAWKLAQSPQLDQLYTMPGNPGTAQLGINISGDPYNLESVAALASKYKIDLVVIGPEAPLASGLSNHLHSSGIPVFGPSQNAAQLESSKSFAKNFMARHHLPTAEYQTFTEYEAARQFISDYSQTNPQLPVIKASGLAAGKGVILPTTLEEAEEILAKIMLEKCFGDAGNEVVIEERLAGREVSVMAFTDGETIIPMPPAQDHKRLLDNDGGPNTGGMGVFAPTPHAPQELIDQIVAEVLQPTVRGMRAEGSPYTGVLYAGMMLTSSGPKVLEFNSRFGDPETQVIVPLLESDLLEVMLACVEGRLTEIKHQIRWRDTAAVCVVLASKGYPGSYEKGVPIYSLDMLPEDIIAFHAGTKSLNGHTVTNGGRVLGITSQAATIDQARTQAYGGIKKIRFEGMQYRQDIGLKMDI